MGYVRNRPGVFLAPSKSDLSSEALALVRYSLDCSQISQLCALCAPSHHSYDISIMV